MGTIIALSVIIAVSAVTFIIVTFINIHIFGLGTGLTYIVWTKCTVEYTVCTVNIVQNHYIYGESKIAKPSVGVCLHVYFTFITPLYLAKQ